MNKRRFKIKLVYILNLIISILLISQNSLGQTNAKISYLNSKTITINPFGVDQTIKRIKFGERVKFEINNVNTFKVNPYVINELANIKDELIKLINSKAQEDKHIEPDKRINFNYGEFASVQEPNSLEIQFINNFEEFLEIYQNIGLITNLENELSRRIPNSTFISDINIKILRDACKSQYQLYYPDLDQTTDKEKIIEALKTINIKFTSLKYIYEKLLGIRDYDSYIMNGYLQTAIHTNKIQITGAEVKWDLINHFEAEFKFAEKVINELNDTKTKKALIRKAHAGIDLYYKIAKENFIMYTESLPVNDDYILLTPLLLNSNGTISEELHPYYLRTYGGVKVDFSSGYLLSFGGDDNYSIYRDSIGNNKGVGTGTSNEIKLTHALGALAHIYRRSANDFNYSFTTGVSLTNNASLGFYFGASLLFLEKNRLIISGGYSFLKLNQLNEANLYKVDEGKYEFISPTDNEIKYDQVYKGAFFLGITYNLSGNNQSVFKNRNN